MPAQPLPAIGLSEAIASTLPDAVPEQDYFIRDDSDGLGPRIVKWDEAQLGPRPTDDEIEKAKAAVMAVRQSEKVAEDAAQAEHEALVAKLDSGNFTVDDHCHLFKQLIERVNKLEEIKG